MYIYIYIYTRRSLGGLKARIFALRPSLRPQASGAKASDLRFPTQGADLRPQGLKPQTPGLRSQVPDLRPQGLNPKTPGLSLRPQVPGLRSAKTPRQATTSTISGLR